MSLIKKKKKHDEKVLLATTKLNTTQVLISKALINSDIKLNLYYIRCSIFTEKEILS